MFGAALSFACVHIILFTRTSIKWIISSRRVSVWANKAIDLSPKDHEHPIQNLQNRGHTLENVKWLFCGHCIFILLLFLILFEMSSIDCLTPVNLKRSSKKIHLAQDMLPMLATYCNKKSGAFKQTSLW